MNKPMYCPMSFGQSLPKMNRRDGEVEVEPYYFECTPDCAWAVKSSGNYGCSLAHIAASMSAKSLTHGFSINLRPLKDDDE